jgi:hypothetical protein
MDGTTRPTGPVRGRYGVTRDPDGSLSVIWGWPWFWRYPVGLTCLVMAAWFGLASEYSRSPVLNWLIGGVGAFVALSITYELLVLVVLGLASWGLYKAATASQGGWMSAASLGAACFVAVGVYHLLRRADDAQNALSSANARLAAIEQRLESMHRELWQQGRGRAPDLDDDN